MGSTIDDFVDVIGKIASCWPASRGHELLPAVWAAALQKQQPAGNADVIDV